MKTCLLFLKRWALLVAMVLGATISDVVVNIAFISPYLISLILVITFSKLSIKSLKITTSHLIFLAFQIFGSITIYYLLKDSSYIAACGAMICFLIPTATSAPAVVRILDGDVEYVTTYLFISNLVMIIVIPLIFSLVGHGQNLDFIETFIGVIKRVGPLLFFPLLIAWGIKYTLPKLNEKLVKYSYISFYIWALALVIVTGNSCYFLSHQHDLSITKVLILFGLSLPICALQFWMGRTIGTKLGENRVGCQQTLGQKNTILAIWLAQTFLDPLSAIVPAGYVIWQNLLNSFEVTSHRRKVEK